ncbi:MAG: T9SS type A sorting domain-containing protein [Sphingobacteriales bacterium JAD_PAG50586_3]|nr:MAG: T9SS type A sorting domain-containing protein [Sphingobacteriales bacterium JAD_PAG50586_3]
MLRLIVLLVAVLPLWLNAQVYGFEKCANVKSLSNANPEKSTDIASVEELKYDVKYHKIELGLDNTSTYITDGKVTTLAQVTATPFTIFVFELLSDLSLDSVKINGSIRPVTSNGSVRTVSLSSALSVGSLFTAEIFYHGQGDVNNGFFSGITTETDNDYNFNATWTLSESYHAYEWWPCKQLLTDKIDSSDVWITVNSNLKAGSNGVLTNVTSLPGNKKRYEWKSRHPIAYYLISVAVANYQEYNTYAHPAALQGDSILIQNYIYNTPAVFNDYQEGMDSTNQLVEYLSDIYGLYPFYDEKYGHCQTPIGGGMEHQTMTTLYGFDFTLVAHELGHQWFGDNVTCGTWGDIWVNEGFASYTEYLSLEHFRVPSDARNWMNYAHAYAMFNPGGSVFCTDTTNENRIFSTRLTYLKGGAIIHSLRFEVNNDSLFFAALRQYQHTYADSNAIGNDVKSVFENVTGLDLTDFFNQWYYGEGYPTISLQYNQSNNQTIVVVSETTSVPNVTPFFKTPLELKLNSAQGDTIVRVYVDQNNQQFTFNWNKPLQSIDIDPNQWILNAVGGVTPNPNLVGLQANEVDTKLNVYPVPATNQLTVNAAKAINTIRLFDMTGRAIESYAGTGESTTIDISTLSAGAYIIEVSFNDIAGSAKRLIVKD